MKRFLLSYDDDNHEKMYWLDQEPIGSLEEPDELLKSIYYESLNDNSFNELEIVNISIEDTELNEQQLDTLHNYLCFPISIDTKVWKKLIKRDYVNAVNIIKNLKKIAE